MSEETSEFPATVVGYSDQQSAIFLKRCFELVDGQKVYRDFALCLRNGEDVRYDDGKFQLTDGREVQLYETPRTEIMRQIQMIVPEAEGPIFLPPEDSA